ncbi:MAG: DUF4350 domain-containing protein [Candidatus Methanosuratincola petrocarbonis]
MKASRAIAIGAVLALVSAVGIILAVPSVDDFSLDNPYWNGMSAAGSDLGISVGGAPDPASTALLIVGPDTPFTAARVEAIRGYLASGGLVLLLDDFGEGNSLLEGLGAPVRVNGSLLLDPLFMERSRFYPRASPAGGYVHSVIMDYASSVQLQGAGTAGVRVLLESSAFSFLDLDGDGEYTAGEPYGPFPVAVEVAYDKGKLVVVSDSSMLINSVYGISKGNAEFVREVAGNRKILADYGNNAASPYASLRSAALSAAGAVAEYPELRYLMAVAGAWALFSVDFRLAVSRLRGFSGDEADGEYTRAAESHPGWDMRLLRETWAEMKAKGVAEPPNTKVKQNEIRVGEYGS